MHRRTIVEHIFVSSAAAAAAAANSLVVVLRPFAFRPSRKLG